MNHGLRFGWGFLITILCQASGYASQPGALTPGMVNPGYEEKPEWFKQSFLDIREDIAEAADEDRRVMLYFYQDGCPYCKKLLQDNFGQREISAKTREYFDVIAINMWGDREVTGLEGDSTTEKDLAKYLKVMFTPTLVMLDEDGQVVLRINGYFPPHRFSVALDFAGRKLERESTFRDYLASVAPAADSGRLHRQREYVQPPYRLAELLRSGDKPLMVLFEQKRCMTCDELHQDILRRPESKALIRGLNVALVDMWSEDERVQTPDGRDLSAAEWARELDVRYAPTMVFFDRDGREVFRAEAYLKSFHVQSVMDYVASGAYRSEPEFQRYVDARADHLREQGVEVHLMD